jgi:hypothetical protein
VTDCDFPRPEAEASVSKLDAARRQLDAAIRMYLANEDELAIHTLAAAAYRILRDLLEKRGLSDLDVPVGMGVYLTAKDYVEGKMGDEELNVVCGCNQEFKTFILNLSGKIRKHGNKFQRLDAKVTLSKAQKRAIWTELSKGSNFLKHADKDHDDVLNQETIKNDLLIRLAIAAYQRFSFPPTNEMFVFYIYYQASNWENGLASQLGSDDLKFVEPLVPMTAAERRLACQTLLARCGCA